MHESQSCRVLLARSVLNAQARDAYLKQASVDQEDACGQHPRRTVGDNRLHRRQRRLQAQRRERRHLQREQRNDRHCALRDPQPRQRLRRRGRRCRSYGDRLLRRRCLDGICTCPQATCSLTMHDAMFCARGSQQSAPSEQATGTARQNLRHLATQSGLCSRTRISKSLAALSPAWRRAGLAHGTCGARLRRTSRLNLRSVHRGAGFLPTALVH